MKRMKREEAYNRIDAIIAKYEIDDEYVTITNSKDYDALRIARKALEQEPSNDMVSREVFEQVMWERNIAIEQLKELGYGFGEEIRTDGDTISRQAVLEVIKNYASMLWEKYHEPFPKSTVMEIMQALPSVTPQQKIGHWIEDSKTYYEELNKRDLGVDEYTPYFTDDIACSECLAKYSMLDNETQFFKHCPNCGAKMVEPQERSGEE